MKIYQLTDNTDKNSSILNTISAFEECYKRLGYETETITGWVERPLEMNKKLNEDDILIYHFYLLYDENVKYLKCKKILMFHNVTDPDCLPGLENVEYRTRCKAGLYDTKLMHMHFDYAMVPSEYSRRMLINAGWDENRVSLIPLLLRNDKLELEPDEEILEKYSSSTNILFTGRVVVSKKQEDVISVFAKYHSRYNSNSKLFIVGNKASDSYTEYLEYLIKKYNLEEHVIITGRVSMKEYVAYFKLAHAFLCLSEHEGFCIPLVEAMHFNVPIIALRKTAVGDTMGASGIIYDNVDIDSMSFDIDRIVNDEEFRAKILESQQLRLNSFDDTLLEAEHKRVIEFVNNRIRQTIFSIDKASDYEKWNFEHEDCLKYKSKEHKSSDIISYGAGAAGIDLSNLLGTRVVAFCDTYKGGQGLKSAGLDILTVEEAVNKYKKAIFVITIQNASVWPEIVASLLAHGVESKNIYFFNREMKHIS